jgi:hypothetical protein
VGVIGIKSWKRRAHAGVREQNMGGSNGEHTGKRKVGALDTVVTDKCMVKKKRKIGPRGSRVLQYKIGGGCCTSSD